MVFVLLILRFLFCGSLFVFLTFSLGLAVSGYPFGIFKLFLGAPELIPGFCGVRVAQYLAFCCSVIVCPFVLFPLAISLSVLRFTASDYPFGIFKLFYDLSLHISLRTCSTVLYLSANVNICSK